MHVLSQEDKIFWGNNGYVIIKNAVPQKNLDAIIREIRDFLEIDGENSENWYQKAPRDKNDENDQSPISIEGMVEMYQHQAIWENRQHPRIY